MDVISCSSKPRPDLSETPIPNSNLVFYTDGSAYRENGVPYAGYAICQLILIIINNFSIIENVALPPSSSAQVAELHAMTEPATWPKVKLLPFTPTPGMLLDVYMTLACYGRTEDSLHPRGHPLNMTNSLMNC